MANLLKLYADTQNNALVQSDSDVAGGFTLWETAVCCPLAVGYSKANRGQSTASSSTPRKRRGKQQRSWRSSQIKAVENHFKSKRQVISEGGGDIEDVFKDIKKDEELAEDVGLEKPSESVD